jgi:hypothetical protein
MDRSQISSESQIHESARINPVQAPDSARICPAQAPDSKSYKELFHDYLIEMFSMLKKIQPDNKRLPAVIQKYRKTDRETYIDYTVTNLEPHIGHICSEDTTIFSDDYASGKPLFLLVGFDFKPFWRSTSLSKEQVQTLFTQLQLLFIYGSLSLKRNKSLVRDMIENIKVASELDREVAEAEAREKEDEGLSGLFGKDNPMMEVFADIVKDPELIKRLDLGNLQAGQNPMEAITKMLSGDKLTAVMSLLQDKLKEKMTAKNLSQEDFERDLATASDKMMRKARKHPLFKTMGLDKMMRDMMERSEPNGLEERSESGPIGFEGVDMEAMASQIQAMLAQVPTEQKNNSVDLQAQLMNMLNSNQLSGLVDHLTDCSAQSSNQASLLETFGPKQNDLLETSGPKQASTLETELARLKRPTN